ncbi:acetylxylan esterase [Halorhabdus sp. BNX81]|uniref:glucuronyl esterase domain-containing protein n=1 Tax=Halorhabdus sp. BNX81 TaxID=2980181 RepID=UPI0023DD334C|nr:acetylxylan esterase [Halorhabdus sp. BNX81]WEL21404.1 Acetylxylan esterase [Halorhabdus sp. BNX81]
MDQTTAHADFPTPSAIPARSALPDPLVALDGTAVETAGEWDARRRPEIRQAFEHYVYGYAPDAPPIEIETEPSTAVLDGQAILEERTICFTGLPADAPTIELAVFTPADRDSVPVFLGLNNGGNHAMIDDPAVTITESAVEFGVEDRGVASEYWCVEQLIERGYGLATFHPADIDPDRDDPTEGIQPYYADLPGPAPTRWGTIAAWAWGLRRGVDALLENPRVRDDGIAVIGHSRLGKAALLAGAFDERIDLVVPHQSGTGGVTPARDNDQETIATITEAFPHWFNDLFPAFGGRPERLPVDQHLLVALVAPRPLLDTEGTRDYWTNPGRALDSIRAADPVYDLLGEDGLVGDGLLYGDDKVTAGTVGTLAQYRRETEHTLNQGYWDAILDFADLHLG